MRIRHKMVCVLACGVLFAAIKGESSAQPKYPQKPIRIVLGSSPGGTPDILARLIGAKLSDSWGQPVVIENRQPAAVGYNLVAKATPDGHTLLLASPAFLIRAALSPNLLPYDTVKDFAGVTEIGFGNIVLVVAPSLGVKSVKEFVAYAMARPGKIFYAVPPAGSADHVNVERLRLALGIKAQHVSFKGQAESLIETVAGRSHFTAPGLTAAMPFIKDGKLIALLQQAEGLQGVPLASEVLPEWKQMGRQSIYAPAGTPIAIRRQLAKEVARVLDLPDVRERLQSVAYKTTPTTPEEHDKNLRADIAAYAKVIKEIGLNPN